MLHFIEDTNKVIEITANNRKDGIKTYLNSKGLKPVTIGQCNEKIIADYNNERYCLLIQILPYVYVATWVLD